MSIYAKNLIQNVSQLKYKYRYKAYLYAKNSLVYNNIQCWRPSKWHIYIYVSAKFGFNYFSSFWEKDWKTKHGKGQLMQTTTSTTEIKWWQQW